MTTKCVVKEKKRKKLKEPMIDYYPTGSEVFLVEDILKNSEDSAMKMVDLEKALPKTITKSKLRQILIYFEKINRILIDKKRKRILYIYNDSPKLRDAINKGIEYG
jgi:lipoprotein-anchoring transpeptidase ErfK/SrfK